MSEKDLSKRKERKKEKDMLKTSSNIIKIKRRPQLSFGLRGEDALFFWSHSSQFQKRSQTREGGREGD